MLRFQIDFPSKTLLRPVPVDIAIASGFLAPPPPYPTVWALHCAMEGGSYFLDVLGCGKLIDQYGMALVAPSLGNGWFINSPFEAQADFLEEIFDSLPQYLCLSTAKEQNVALGISMGGFGALRWALEKDRFGTAISIGGVLTPSLPPDSRAKRDQMALYGVCRKLLARLGDGADFMPDLALLLAQRNAPDTLCQLYCGDDDYLALAQNEDFFLQCESCGQPCALDILPGGHNAAAWIPALEKAFAGIAA